MALYTSNQQLSWQACLQLNQICFKIQALTLKVQDENNLSGDKKDLSVMDEDKEEEEEDDEE